MNYTSENLILDSPSEDIKFYISIGVNIILTIFTIVSETLSVSTCTKGNGMVDIIKKSLSNVRDINDDIKNGIV